jgi:hypothetical protein
MAFPWMKRKANAPVSPTVTAAVPDSAPPIVPRSPWQRFTEGLSAALDAMDDAISGIAIPFGVQVREPRKRFAILQGVFAGLFVLGALPVPYVPLIALALGYIGVLAISRAWVVNERKRTAIVKKLADGNPDELPDLRWTALVSALQLLILFPLLYMQIQWHFHLYKVADSVHFFDWVWFSFDKTYLKALPDWSILYEIHISSIEFASPWGRHLVLLSRLTFDYILLQGLFRLLAIRATIREAVAVVKTDPDVAVRVGSRAVAALIDKLSDPDRAVRGAAANALTQIGDPEGLRQMSEAIHRV